MRAALKYAYDRLPFKAPLFKAIRPFWRPPFYSRLHFDGDFRVRVDSSHSFRMRHYNRYGVETDFFWRGYDDAWEAASRAAWATLCADARVILDVGAHEGVYALLAKCMNPQARVLAFEPLPAAFSILSDNVRLNRYDVECSPLALSDFNGTADLYTDSEFSNEASLDRGQVRGTSISQRPVKVATLASVIEEAGLGRVDMMKVDVEGAEPNVLRGMGAYLERDRPSIVIEILSDEVAEQVEQIVGGLGYLYFDVNDYPRHAPRGYRRVGSLKERSCLNFLLLQPAAADRLNLS